MRLCIHMRIHYLCLCMCGLCTVFTALIISLSAVCVGVCVCFSVAAPQITSVEYQNLFASPFSTSTAGRIGMISRLRDQ